MADITGIYSTRNLNVYFPRSLLMNRGIKFTPSTCL
jgi:hypothetical protein